MDLNLKEENEFLKKKVSQLIADNLELSAKLENDYNPAKPVRQLTLQEKLEINMGNLLRKYRIPAKAIKNIYCSIVREENEPEFVDLSFDNDRLFTAFYFVDLVKEQKEIEKGMDVDVKLDDINLLPPELEQQLDMQNVLNKITDIEVKT